jgi:hypothetical protein
MNPPYGDEINPWLEKTAKHGNGTALIFARTETANWELFVWPKASAILFLYGRLYFYLPDGTRAHGNAGGPSALIAYGERDAAILRESGINGAFVENIRS